MTIVVFNKGTLYCDSRMINADNVSGVITAYESNKIISRPERGIAYAYSGIQPSLVMEAFILLFLSSQVNISKKMKGSTLEEFAVSATDTEVSALSKDIVEDEKIAKECFNILKSMKDVPLFIGGNKDIIFARTNEDSTIIKMSYTDTICIGSDASQVYALIRAGFTPTQAIKKAARISTLINDRVYSLNLSDIK